MSRRSWPGVRALVCVVVVLIAAAVGYALRGAAGPAAFVVDAGKTAVEAGGDEAQQIWTCSMHPQIRLPRPGLCPICRMPLVPVESAGGADQAAGPRLVLSESARALVEIRTAPVERRFVQAEIRMVGKVDYDETLLKSIAAWVPGRLERLYVDYTGMPVRKGDHMVLLYSPQLLSTQHELLEALRSLKELSESDVEVMRETARATVQAARDRLKLWGLNEEQVAEIERRGSASDHVTIYAPLAGIVVEKHAHEGDYVQTGTPIYTVADLSRVWVKLDAYESDLMWLRYGQEVNVTAEAYPGEEFHGRIAFIEPVVSEATRTVKVRVHVPNPDGRLKPGMYVHAVVRPRVAAGGRVMAPDLAGRWICPMHPEVVRDEPGECDVCGMPLESAESLGYVAAEEQETAAPLVIPVTAPLLTGKRAVVYVEVPGLEPPAYEGREVVLGPRAGGYYIVREGLQEGERVVIQGAFKIDSELQIRGEPSMMSPSGGGQPAMHHHGAAGPEGSAPKAAEPRQSPPGTASRAESTVSDAGLDHVWAAYRALHAALASDDPDGAERAVAELCGAVSQLDAETPATASLRQAAAAFEGADDIDALRRAFGLVSEALEGAVRRAGPGWRTTVYKLHCPMAFDGEGADWLQAGRSVRNPYFGSAMLECGEIVEVITAPGADPMEGHPHG